MENIRVGVVGATGKMGREILKAVTNDPQTEVIFGVGLVDEPVTITVEGHDIPVTADLDAALNEHDVDVVIDFTNADAFRQNASVALAHGVHLVSGTTGLKHEELGQTGCRTWKMLFLCGKLCNWCSADDALCRRSGQIYAGSRNH